MGTIIAIGGGFIEKRSTEFIDKFIINSIKKDIVKVLLLPTPCNDNENYIETFTNYYSSLGAHVDVLKLSIVSNENIIRSKIFTSDIIYVGPGNTGKCYRVFKRTNLIPLLNEALNRGIVLTGLSAGASIFFKTILSDANRSTNSENPLSNIKGIGFLDYYFTSHYDSSERQVFDEMVKEQELDGVAIENDAAVIFKDGKIYRVISETNKAYCFKNGYKEEIL